MALPPLLRQRRTWIIAVPVLVFLVAVVGPFVYINVIQDDPPERLTLSEVTTTTTEPGATTTTGDTATTTGDGVDGTWSVTDGSTAGYRVGEVLFGQDAEATGRTSAVTGTLAIAGTTISEASFEVDMTSIASDQSRRDGQFHGRIMETSTFPTSTFALTEPITLD
ncbi:MAG: YceI family protein, partial [Acidimicrobiales bacterium]